MARAADYRRRARTPGPPHRPVPAEQAGRVTVAMLLSLLTDRAPARDQRRMVVLPTHLTIRDSTGALAGTY